jgi:hypothetical protein
VVTSGLAAAIVDDGAIMAPLDVTNATPAIFEITSRRDDVLDDELGTPQPCAPKKLVDSKASKIFKRTIFLSICIQSFCAV